MHILSYGYATDTGCGVWTGGFRGYVGMEIPYTMAAA